MNKTEERNLKSTFIDRMSTSEMVNVMQAENYNSVKALDDALPSIVKTIDEIFARMSKGGRLFYVGCGTSGRLGVLDASECPPTYGVSPDLVVGIIAGGDKALRNAVENVEDDASVGKSDLEKFNLTSDDSVVGISAAGGARYVEGAVKYAKSKGAFTVLLTSNTDTPIEKEVDLTIITQTGAEVVTGSTRMKAGSAHKFVLNMISTGVMIKSGYVYENLMINLKPSNKKLAKRMINIVISITGTDEKTAKTVLEQSGWNIKTAVKNIKG